MKLRKGLWVVPLFILLMVTAGCVSIPTGDGGSLKISKDGLNFKSADGEEAAIKYDAKDGGVTYSGKDKDGNVTEGQISLKNELPKDFPKEIPVPSEATVEAVISNDTDEGQMHIISLLVKKGEVIDYYNQYRAYAETVKDAEVTDSSEGKAKADTMQENIFITKENGDFMSIGIMKTGTGEYDKGEVGIQIMYSETKG